MTNHTGESGIKNMFMNKNNQIRSGWLILITLVIWYVSQYIFSYPVVTLFDIMEASGDYIIPQVWDEYFIILGSLIGGTAAIFVSWRVFNKKYPLDIGLRGSWKDLVFGLIFGAGLIILGLIVLLLTKDVTIANPITKPNIHLVPIAYILVFTLVGFEEELLTRGYFMKTMAERGNKKWLIYVVSAGIFALLHMLNPNLTVLSALNILLAGFLLAYMFDRTGNLWMPIGFHITWNYFQGSVFSFPVSGFKRHAFYDVELLSERDWLTGGSFGLEGGIVTTLLLLLAFYLTHVYAKWQKKEPLFK